MSRIYQTQESIDGDKIRQFFNARAKKENNAVNAVMLQSAGSTLATDRDEFERANLIPKLEKPSRILELGCGAGRLSLAYNDGSHEYLGLDFSEDLIALANAEAAGNPKLRFQVAELPHVDPDALLFPPPFDLIIVTAVLLYLNDEAVRDTFALIAGLAAPGARIYVRESLSDMDVRLTLKEHYSEELGETYNAIYRTTADLKSVMDETLIAAGFRYEVCGDYAFPPELRNRAETAQRYFTLVRS